MIRRIAKNTFFLSFSQLAARAIGFLYLIFLARSIGVENFGTYIFTLAFIYNFIPVADFGLERLILRDLARNPNLISLYAKKLFPLRILIGVAAVVSALILGIILRLPPKQIGYFFLAGLSLIPYSLVYFLTSFQSAQEKMEWSALANILTISLTAVTGVVFIFLRFGLEWLFLAYLVGNFLTASLFMLEKKRWGLSIGLEVDWPFWQKALSQSWVFAALTIIAVFYLRLSVVMMGLISGNYLTGLYGSVFKFVEAIILVPQSFAVAMFPLSSRLFLTDLFRLRKIYIKGLGVLLGWGLLFFLIFSLMGERFIAVIYGREYLAAARIMPILGFSLVLFFLNVLPGVIIQNSPLAKTFLPLSVLNLLVALGLCLLLIPAGGLFGAAWAVVGGEIIGLLINNWWVFRILKKENEK